MSALRRVLVVDDDPVVGKSFNRVLSGKGYAVITAANGEEALAKLQAESYDAVFTDLRMPGMNGLEVAERIKAQQPWTPVVIVTGYGSQASEERARAAGVTEFLHKPLSPEMIEGSAERVLQAKAPQAPAVAEDMPVAAPAAPARQRGTIANMLLFLSAPFVGLLYAVLLPFVGLGMLAWFGAKAVWGEAQVREAARFAGFMLKVVGAPFIGLAYILAYPFVGLAMLLWTGAKGLVAPATAE